VRQDGLEQCKAHLGALAGHLQLLALPNASLGGLSLETQQQQHCHHILQLEAARKQLNSFINCRQIGG
jgi:hypothetical protein